MLKIILLILNCKKYDWKRKQQKEGWIKDLPSNISYFHVIGDEDINNEFIFDEDNRILLVKCKDDYNSLPEKVVNALDAVNETYEYDYIYKTDDDQDLINPNFFNIIENHILQNKYRYGGHISYIDDHYSNYKKFHNELPSKLFLKKAVYASGRFYFIDKGCVTHLIKSKKRINEHYIEDHCMGLYLGEILEEKDYIDINTTGYLNDIKNNDIAK